MSELWRMDQTPKEVEFTYKGEKVVLEVRPLSWSKKNQIVSQATGYSKDGEGKFNLDHYNKQCLTYMIVKAPWGETNNIFLSSIDDDLGGKLQQLVPAPFAGDEEKVTFLGQESESSSTEEETNPT